MFLLTQSLSVLQTHVHTVLIPCLVLFGSTSSPLVDMFTVLVLMPSGKLSVDYCILDSEVLHCMLAFHYFLDFAPYFVQISELISRYSSYYLVTFWTTCKI
jgi:hypothetical protein